MAVGAAGTRVRQASLDAGGEDKREGGGGVDQRFTKSKCSNTMRQVICKVYFIEQIFFTLCQEFIPSLNSYSPL